MKSLTESIYESVVDTAAVRELGLIAWNTYDITKQIEDVIKAMNKKDPSTISIEHLAGSSVMQKIVAACAKEEGMKLDTATRKAFAMELAEEMVERMDEYK